MQFETIIKCRVPRINCSKHGVKTVNIPWADSYSRFTSLFEKFAIDVLISSKNIKSAVKFFNKWYFWATHSKLKPIIKSAKTLKRHFDGIITYLKHKITNAVSEGINSKIQSIKSNARGFRNFQNYRIAILFHCGKLDLYP